MQMEDKQRLEKLMEKILSLPENKRNFILGFAEGLASVLIDEI